MLEIAEYAVRLKLGAYIFIGGKLIKCLLSSCFNNEFKVKPGILTLIRNCKQ